MQLLLAINEQIFVRACVYSSINAITYLIDRGQHIFFFFQRNLNALNANSPLICLILFFVIIVYNRYSSIWGSLKLVEMEETLNGEIFTILWAQLNDTFSFLKIIYGLLDASKKLNFRYFLKSSYLLYFKFYRKL